MHLRAACSIRRRRSKPCVGGVNIEKVTMNIMVTCAYLSVQAETTIVVPACQVGFLLAGLIRAVETVAFELDRYGRIHLAHLLLSTLRAYGDRVVVERLLFSEVIAAVLAAVVISRQRIPPQVNSHA